jgi:hypothetical protein
MRMFGARKIFDHCGENSTMLHSSSHSRSAKCMVALRQNQVPILESSVASKAAGAHRALSFLFMRSAGNGEVLWGEVNVGVSGQVRTNTTLFANASYQSRFDGGGFAYTGKAGVRVYW